MMPENFPELMKTWLCGFKNHEYEEDNLSLSKPRPIIAVLQSSQHGENLTSTRNKGQISNKTITLDTDFSITDSLQK